ncbi:pyridoxal phosphate-dependent aminotransferase family protein [Mycobacterium sp. TY815]|uniref:aminotransferase class I/II-fold pyridoxal phosphate-dependent enzyme n=1 Tax=Mycobacterium sp. TY815 TaxID=3050581 RepID=UPI002740C923|nr:pyridoxal phosphate-dependent aminotransferase family protein [Mycobacterium sp. TY815]MDP7702752.1 pyridoxal phosphate-dependent aminotransferase family protein [Mycobacterium sp. TY815]
MTELAAKLESLPVRSAALDPATLTGSMLDFRDVTGDHLINRLDDFYEWQDRRREHSLWFMGRSTEAGPRRRVTAYDDAGRRMDGINFASQDYLSLSGHPAIKAAAVDAIEEYGVHSAGSPALVGNTSVSLALERRIAEFVGAEHVSLFPTGWAAGYGVVKGLVRPSDHILMDRLSHACLQEGARAATPNIRLFGHNDVADLRAQLESVRSHDTRNGIMIVTEALFSMDSDTPDIAAMQDLAKEFRATLVVDVAHDLGCLGLDGRGHIGLQGMIGKVDLVMGSFSKTFASNGGFVATNHRKVKEYLRYYSSPNTFSNALSPIQAAVVLRAFEIVDSPEGASLRQQTMTNVQLLRGRLSQAGFETYGAPSPIVCVKIGNEGLARLTSRWLQANGLVANLVEFPGVAKGKARLRMQVMSNHTDQDISDAVARVAAAHRYAKAEITEVADASD